ncbi:hypothetical protein A4D02_29065 [Niastella koreensis]|uniref:Alpha/beta hydrolase fold-3 domain-containing protein n=2 Tax=Niastella koreensis TaxID=354356 RepID=G8TRC8_NIAKG|nr:alpha/beta hydrolase fold domain-containing protein [Niastella koreensis]AEW00050.1 hypothetical protein Niako_3754 [Niastella koreensis GR20-10]OQP49643.1 hypothetical protein A4D02_29065 [Niastella koreensis]
MVNLIEERAGFELLGRQYPVARHVVIENTSIANVRCAWVIPATAVADEVVMYIHGGGFIYGSVNSHAALVSHIAQAINRKALVIDYPLAPEHPFPAGLNDCVNVIETFCKQHPTITFGIMGDSAGGKLHQQYGKAGVQSECIEFEGEQHVWPFNDIAAAASKKALGLMADFVGAFCS